MIRRALLALALTLAGAFSTAAQSTIAQWDFNNTNAPLAATTGSGLITAIGGVSVSSNSGAGSSDPAETGDQALGLGAFPAQGNGPRTAGIEIASGTAGFRDVVLAFDFRASNTGSRRIQVLYTLNGTDYSEGPAFTITAGAVFTNRLTADFAGIVAANDNPQFKVRIVSDFDGGSYQAVSGTYGSAGTWRFDYVTLTGNSSGGAPVAPTITSQPQDLTAFVGGNAQFGVSVSGTAPFFFQWSRNGQILDGATGQTLRITNLTSASQARFSVSITNAVGRADSEEAVLTVVADPNTVATPIATVRQAFLPVVETNTNNVNSATLYTVEGVVTTFVSLTTAGNALFYIQDDSGGMPVFWGTAGFVPAAGDRLRVRGPGTFFNGLLELVPGAAGGSVTRISSGNPLPAPRPLPLENLVTRQDGSGPLFDPAALEAFEGSLVIVTNVILNLPGSPALNFPSGANLTLLDSTGVPFDPALFNFRVDARVLDLIGQPVPVGPIAITAVLAQFDSSNPRTVGYQLTPTRMADILTDSRPAVVRFTNVLSNRVRPGDLPTNSFTEITLLPGESLSTQASAYDVDGLPVEIVTSGEPAGASWLVTGSGTANPTISLTWSATEANAGNSYAATIEARTSRATNTVVLQLYTPTVAEQGIVITEFAPAPTDVTNSPAYNLLRRASYPAFNANSSPGNLDEYIEIVNVGTEPVDLLGWTLADAVADTHQFFVPVTLSASGAAVIYGGPLNGSEPTLPAGVYYEPASLANNGRLLALNNGGDTVLLRNGARRLISRILYGGEGTNIASQVRNPSVNGPFVPHTSAGGRYGTPGLRPGGALWSEPDSVVVELPTITLPPASRTNFNGTLASFTVGVGGTPPFTYQWRRGTTAIAGATNSTLSLTNVQSADQGSYTVLVGNSAGFATSDPASLTVVLNTSNVRPISEVRSQLDAISSTNNVPSAASYTVEGVVTTEVNLASAPSFLFYIQDDSAGIAVFLQNPTLAPRSGDRVRVTAPITYFNGLLELIPNGTNAATAVSLIRAGNALPSPVVLDSGTSDFAMLDALEGQRVVLQNVRFDLTSANFSGGQNVTVTNTAGSTGLIVRIDSRVPSIIGTARPTGPANVVGVLGQFDSSNPRSTGYQVIPTRLADITAGEVVHPPIRLSLQVVGPSQVQVTWNSVTGRTYRILRYSTLGGAPVIASEGILAGAFIDNPGAGGTYFYRVIAP